MLSPSQKIHNDIDPRLREMAISQFGSVEAVPQQWWDALRASSARLGLNEGLEVRIGGKGRQMVDRKVAQRALDAKTAELQRVILELEKFAYVASHDLQEPLRSIASYVQLLERRYRDQLDEVGVEYIEYAVEGAKRMQDLIRDLLAYSTLATGQPPKERVDLGDAAKIALSNLQQKVNDTQANVIISGLPAIEGDGLQWISVFEHLLDNCFKFRSKAAPRVEIRAEEGEDGVVITVRDNGLGIDPIYSEKIFVIFKRLHNRERFQGTGLGLALCRKVVERHSGQIEFHPVKDGGSEIRITLPRRRLAKAAPSVQDAA